MNTTPAKEANSRERRIRFAPTVSHQTTKKGFKPVKANPINRRFRVAAPADLVSSNLDVRESRICMAPKTRRTIPPATPTMRLTVGLTLGSFATARRPPANSMTRVNSTKVCAIENTKPLLAPVLAPWEMVTKNKGPGAKAPEAVIRTTVATKFSGSIRLENLDADN